MAAQSATTSFDVPRPRRPQDCPVEHWLSFLGHRWNALILWHLQDAPKRHGALADLLPGITAKVLAERLAGLERRELIRKIRLATFPRGVLYMRTPQGKRLMTLLNQLESWSKRLDQSRLD